LSSREGIDFTDLVVGSFIASIFVWAWLQLSSILRFYEAPAHMQHILSFLQYGFIFLGGFTSSAIISLKTGCLEVREGLKIGIGGWLISTTLFLPWTENPTVGAVVMILIMFLTGSYLGFKTSSRRMKTKK
jgi:hypothetical protein